MSVRFFDANVFIGCRAKGTYKPVLTGEDLTGRMRDTGIQKALVWHIAQFDAGIRVGNELLSSCILGREELFGCWTILPPCTHELPDLNDFFRQMKNDRVFALRVFSKKHRFVLDQVSFGKFLNEITERKIPLFLSLQEYDMNWDKIYQFLKENPKLTCILYDFFNWGSDRYFRPLLETYENVYIETNLISLCDGAIEDIVLQYGSKRLVFGSGYPEKEPLSSMLQLKHADISEEQKTDIAGGNLERLLGGVVL